MAKVTRRTARKTRLSTRRTRSVKTRPAKASAAADAVVDGFPAKPPRKGKEAQAAEVIARLTKRLAEARRHIARLEAYADTDPLLDIPNRRGFQREMSRCIAYVKRYVATAALLIVDVDRLKLINDSFGHAAGDHLLKVIVRVLSQNIRQSDTIGRLGGDEFGIILWNLAEADALAKAVALEQAIEQTACEYRGRRIRTAVSIGVAVIRADDGVATVLERADQAMYARKHSRRDNASFGVTR